MVFGWGICVAICFLGWGILARRVFRLGELPLAISGTLGVCIVVAAGGLLNLARLIIIPVLSAIVIAGVLLFCLEVIADRRYVRALHETLNRGRHAPLLSGLTLLLAGAITLLAFAHSRHPFVGVDDVAFYLGYPLKISVAGMLPLDPFSGSRTMSSLGGNYFLQTLMLPAGDMGAVGFPDVGVGYFFLATGAWAFARTVGLSHKYCLFLAALATSLPFVRTNLQMYILPACLLLSCAVLMLTFGGRRLAVLLGLFGGTVSVLKGTYIPGLAFVFATYYLIGSGKEWRSRATNLFLTGLTAVLVMAPWMFDLKRKTGTYLYPLLGKGNVHAPYVPTSVLYVAEATLPLFAALVALSLLLWAGMRSGSLSRMLSCPLSFTLGSAMGLLAVGYATGGESVGRYSLALIDPATILVAAFIFRATIGGRDWNKWLGCSACLLVFWVLFLQTYYGLPPYGDYRTEFAEIRMLFSPDVELPFTTLAMDDAVIAKYRKDASAYQSVVPPGETLLSAVAAPFAPDFARNNIYIDDGGSWAGLPPGMPTGDPERLRQYLLDNRIYFVAFADETDPQEMLRRARANPPGRRAMIRSYALAIFTTRADLDKLSSSVAVLFDDGHTRVLDLRHKSTRGG